jgi:hypothetical protein
MRYANRLLALAVVGWAVQSGQAYSQTIPQAKQASPRIVAHSASVSPAEASLEFELSNGEIVRVSFTRGEVRSETTVGGATTSRVLTRYDRDSDLATAWWSLLDQSGRLDPTEMLEVIQRRTAAGSASADAGALATIMAPFLALEAVPATEQPARAPRPRPATRSSESSSAVVREPTDAQYSTVVRRDNPGLSAAAGQVVEDIIGLLASFASLCALGFGLVFFAPRQLEVVADTVRQSFWRSFLAGLFAQPLIVPLLGMLILGLALTVVGILVIPFAIAAFVVAAALGVLGGYLAVAHSVGETYLRHRMAQGNVVGGWLAYRYIVYGLVALLAIWLPAVLFSWAPIAGKIATTSAVLSTWILATAGFGAAVLSRAGIRGTFTRQLDRALSDEYLCQTPPATPVAGSHDRIQRPR